MNTAAIWFGMDRWKIYLARDHANPGSARILRAGEGILPSRTFQGHASSAEFKAKRFHTQKSSSPQNAATSTLQACAPQSLTRDYLTRRKSIPLPKSRRKWTSSIKILGARRAQFEKYRRRVAARRFHVCNWSVRVRQIHSDSRCVVPESAARQGTILRSGTGRMQIDHRHPSNRRCSNGESVTACSHAAFNSDSLSRFV